MFRHLIFALTALLSTASLVFAAEKTVATAAAEPRGVAILPMKMLVLPGTQFYLRESLQRAAQENRALVVIQLDTPGGVLQTTQEMAQEIFQSTVPVAIYVHPQGATATSAGAFLTLAAHVAAMTPGTTIGAAHPVSGDGKDIGGDMRAKAENAAASMIRSFAEQRGRNAEWAVKAVTESKSVTDQEALKQKVIDLSAADMDALLTGIAGKRVQLPNGERVLADLSKEERIIYEISMRDTVINFVSHPNIAALLWLAATTGLSIELYNPGLVLPGVVGVIALILALAVGQVIPFSTGALSLLIVGAVLLVVDMFLGTIALGIGGIIAFALGALYLIDPHLAPGLAVSPGVVLPPVILFGAGLLWIGVVAVKFLGRRPKTGKDGMVGARGKVIETVTNSGTVSVGGEVWKARCATGLIAPGAAITVLAVEEGLVLLVDRAANE